MSKPLDGVRVLDLSRLLPGPFATMLLAGQGAAVDKVEDPHGGDYLRHMAPLAGDSNVAFEALNRGKRSLVLDLKTDAGKAALKRLVRHYDVLVESFRPGVMARLGLGEDVLRAENPRLIVCALSGYGRSGPLAGRAGHDLNFLARSGVLGMTGPAALPPAISGAQIADVGGALYAVSAITSALYARERSGVGAFIDIALADAATSFGLLGMLSHVGGLATSRGESPLTGGIAPYATYATKDGGAISLAALEPKFWMTFCAAVGLAPSLDALVPGDHQAALSAEVAAIVSSKTREEWAAFAETHDCCLEVVLGPDELAGDAHHVARGNFGVLETGGLALRTPLESVLSTEPAPKQGEHSRDVLAGAGFRDGEIAALVKA